jgi:hypothetical protein
MFIYALHIVVLYDSVATCSVFFVACFIAASRHSYKNTEDTHKNNLLKHKKPGR